MAKTRRQFQEFHEANPRIYQLFCYFAGKVQMAGHNKYSAEAIFNQIRWYTTVETRGDEYKINNDYKPYYSRMYMRDHNCDLFRVRSSVADINQQNLEL
jgi:hypothetical protein